MVASCKIFDSPDRIGQAIATKCHRVAMCTQLNNMPLPLKIVRSRDHRKLQKAGTFENLAEN